MLRKLVRSVVSARLLDSVALSDHPAVDARTVHQEFMANDPLRGGGVESGAAFGGVVGGAPATAHHDKGELCRADGTAATNNSGGREYAASHGREAAAPTGERKDHVWREEAAQLRQVGAKLKQVLEAEMRSRGLSGLDLDFEWDNGVSENKQESAETPAVAVEDKTDANLAQVSQEQEAVKHQEAERESKEERRQREMIAAELQRERERADFLQLELQKIQHDLQARTVAAPAGDEETSKEQATQAAAPPDDAPVDAQWPPMTLQDLTEIFTTLDADGNGRVTHRQLLRGLTQHTWVAEKLGAPASADAGGSVPDRCLLAFGEIRDDDSRTIGELF
jgi:hypothetical protein